jgi:hypothetical protein
MRCDASSQLTTRRYIFGTVSCSSSVICCQVGMPTRTKKLRATESFGKPEDIPAAAKVWG